MASHNARDPLRREAFVLRQLQTLTMWRGSLIHDSLHWNFVPTLSSHQPISKNELEHQTHNLADIRYSYSRDRKYRNGVSKAKAGMQFCALFEHEYGSEVSLEDINKIKSEISACYENLYNNEMILLKLKRGNWFGSEMNLPFPMEDASVSGKLDLVFFSGDELNILDWKVGESESSDYSMQLQVYAMAVSNKWCKPLNKIHLMEYNLLTNEIKNHSSSEDHIHRAEDFIYRSISDIRSLTGDNPYEKLDFHDFECARSSMTCIYCKFRSLCQRLLHD